MYTKLIRYRLRKINADKRPRIKGRFIKKEAGGGRAAAAADMLQDSDYIASSDQCDECMRADSAGGGGGSFLMRGGQLPEAGVWGSQIERGFQPGGGVSFPQRTASCQVRTY